MERALADLGGAGAGGAGGAPSPPAPGIGKKPRFADVDREDLDPARAGTTRIMGLPTDVMVTVFGLLDLKTLVMVIPSVSSNPPPFLLLYYPPSPRPPRPIPQHPARSTTPPF